MRETEPAFTAGEEAMSLKSSNAKRLFSQSVGSADSLKEPPSQKARSDYKVRQLLASEGFQTNDEVHSTINVDPICACIVNTAPFQRLRNIKQLGRADLVFMNCNHTRFEHSIGVAYLAHRLVTHIQQLQPQLGVTARDVQCIKLAGLLHDVGHGPFSHVYEGFCKRSKAQPPLPKGWRHESVSLAMINCILEVLGLKIDLHNLDGPLRQIGDGVDANSLLVFDDHNKGSVLTSRDFLFVKECIWGGPIPEVKEVLGLSTLQGRVEPNKNWMYDIVTNRHSGLDVDKIDYFARDQRRAFRGAGEIERRMIDEAVVAWVETDNTRELMICYPEKMVSTCLEFFKIRYKLHSVIYRHKTVCSASYVLEDILNKADEIYRISTTRQRHKNAGPPEYESLPISRAMLDPYAFLALDDTIIERIACSEDTQLAEAQDLIYSCYMPRALYKCAHQQAIDMENEADQQMWTVSTEDIIEQLLSVNGVHDRDSKELRLSKHDIIVEQCSIHHGLKDKNPISRINFLPKSKLPELANEVIDLPTAAPPNEKDFEDDIPRSFQKHSIRVFTRDPEKTGLLGHTFFQWRDHLKNQMKHTPTKQEVDFDPNMEPVQLTQEEVPMDSDDDGGAYSPLAGVQSPQIVMRLKNDADDR